MKNDDPALLTTIHSTLWAWENDLDLTKDDVWKKKNNAYKTELYQNLYLSFSLYIGLY